MVCGCRAGEGDGGAGEEMDWLIHEHRVRKQYPKHLFTHYYQSKLSSSNTG